MKKIAFWLNDLGERGTAIAVYDYAFYNQLYNNNISIILYEDKNENNVNEVIEKFKQQFIIKGLDDFSFVDEYLLQNKIDILYVIKSGEKDNKISKVAKTFIHCVFNCSQPHGDIYTAISNSVVGWNKSVPVLPHMICLPEHSYNMRENLNIPENAIVFGRYGGKQQFDIMGVHNIIYNIAINNPNIYFVFVNTNEFCSKLNNIIHLKMIVDLNEKRKFINTCDAMIWARSDGETFGLSIGEFSTCNKPIIAYKHENISSDFHIKTLGNNAYWFKSQDEFINIILSFNQDDVKGKDWNMYKEYTPLKVMEIFNKLIMI